MDIPVEFVQVQGAPKGLQFFRCTPMSATISTKACATNWKAAHEEQAERLFKCKTCPVGAVHAGETAASLSPLRGSTICGRCHRGATRLIGGHLCISCYNREREAVLGENAKGKRPQKLSSVSPRALRVMAGGEPLIIRRERTAGPEELFVMALRDQPKRVVFCWDQNRPAKFAQKSLW